MANPKRKAQALTPDAEERGKALFRDIHDRRGEDFGNGRDVRGMYDEIRLRQAK